MSRWAPGPTVRRVKQNTLDNEAPPSPVRRSDNIIRRAEERISKDLQVEAMVTTQTGVALSAGAQTLAKPADLVACQQIGLVPASGVAAPAAYRGRSFFPFRHEACRSFGRLNRKLQTFASKRSLLCAASWMAAPNLARTRRSRESRLLAGKGITFAIMRDPAMAASVGGVT